MPSIKMTINEKKISVEGNPIITCGNSDYVIIFTFDKEWEAYDTKTARFVYIKDGTVQHQDVVFNGSVTHVPVFTGIRWVNVGVFAGDLKTSTPARVSCDSCILCDSGAVGDPSPDVYNQIMELYQSCVTKVGALEKKVNGLGSGGSLEGAGLTDLTQKVNDIEESLTPLKTGADEVAYSNVGDAHAANNAYMQENRRMMDEDIAYHLQFDPTGEFYGTVEDAYYATREYVKANRDLITELQTNKANKQDLEKVTVQTESAPWDEDGKSVDNYGNIVENADYTISEARKLPIGTEIVATGGHVGVYLYDLATGAFTDTKATLSSGESYTLQQSAMVRLTADVNGDALIVKHLTDAIDRIFDLETKESVSSLPAVTTDDDGKRLEVVNGSWQAVEHSDTQTGGVTDEKLTGIVAEYLTKNPPTAEDRIPFPVDGDEVSYGNPGQVLMSDGNGGTYWGEALSNPVIYYKITYKLSNCAASNNVTKIEENKSYTTVLSITTNEGTLGVPVVTMGGADITAEAWNADTATVTIVSVTGDVVITCGIIKNDTTGATDTSPMIAKENVGYSSSKTIENADGVCITQIYRYEPDVVAIKESAYYDATNDYTTIAGVCGVVYIYTPSVKAREKGFSINVTKSSKVVYYRDNEIVDYSSNASLTASSSPEVQKLQMARQKTDITYSNGIAFTLSMYDIDDSYAYWGSNSETILPIGVRSGDIIFAGKNTQYYGMSNIDGTVQGVSSTDELSLENDLAMDYGIATSSLLGEETKADTQTVYGIDSNLASLIDEARTAWMTEYGGDYRKVPVIVTTDQHGRTNSGIFKMLGKVLNMYDVSKVMNLGDTISTWYDADTSKPLLTESNLDAWLESIKAIPYSKRLDVFGNHDTWYGNHEDESNTVGTRYPSSQAHLNQYFRNIYARRTNNNGWFAVRDDQFNIKYVVVSAFEYQNSAVFRIGTAQMTWLIEELSKNDGYDIVIISHVPLLADPEHFTYPTGQSGTNSYRVSELDTDAFFSARKNKGSGTITDSDGIEHTYDFSHVESPLLCSLHGHTHYDAYLYLDDSLLVNAFDWFDKNTFFFVLIDRANHQLNIWKVEGDALECTNYQIPMNKPTGTE